MSTMEELLTQHSNKVREHRVFEAEAEDLNQRSQKAWEKAEQASNEVHLIEKEIIAKLREQATRKPTEEAAQREMDATHKGSSFP
jgi:hypothetical protein